MKKRSDHAMTTFVHHLLRFDGNMVNLPKTPYGIFPFERENREIENPYTNKVTDILTLYCNKDDTLEEAIARMFATGAICDGELYFYRVLFTIDTWELSEAQEIRDEIFEKLKLYVVKRRVTGSRGWRLGSIRRGNLRYNSGAENYTYSTDILISRKVWYNDKQSILVTGMSDHEWNQLLVATYLARNSTGIPVQVRVKVTYGIDLKSGQSEKLNFITEFA